MSVEIYGGVNKNSLSPRYDSGFTSAGFMKAQEVRIVTTQYNDEQGLDIRFRGLREEGTLYELHVRLPVNLANAVARAILNSSESGLPEIRLCL